MRGVISSGIAAALLSLPLVAWAAPPSEQPALGINLFKVRPYSRELPFADLLMMRGAWRAGGSKAPLSLDAEGWPRALAPGQWVETQLMAGFGPHVPRGELRASWEGEGTLEWLGASARSDGPGRARVTVDPRAPRHGLRIRATDPAKPLRRVALALPDAAAATTGPFNPRFLERWRGVRVVRFMDWGQTNDSPLRRWSERPLPDGPQGTDRGVAVEWMIELANRLNADPWFCIPHAADDAYVDAMARLVKARLAPGRRAWIEYSNEVWNRQFGQADYARAEGMRRQLDPRDRVAAQRFYAQRALEIFAIWERAFGGDARLVRVLAGQFGNVQGAREILSWRKAAERADAYAVGAYFGLRHASLTDAEIAAADDAQLVAELERAIERNRERLRGVAAIAKSFGLPLVAYEGGQHLRGSPRVPGLTERLVALNRSPTMKRLYQLALKQWREEGGTTFVHFSSTSGYGETGSWGALEWWDQPTSPKYEALREAIDAQAARPATGRR